MKYIEKVSSGKVKYDSLTGKSVIDPTISHFMEVGDKLNPQRSYRKGFALKGT